MDRNVGGLDRGLRIVFGPILLVSAIRSLRGGSGRNSSLTAVAAAAGAYLLGTGLLGADPANGVVGRNTARQGELSEEARTVRDRAIQ